LTLKDEGTTISQKSHYNRLEPSDNRNTTPWILMKEQENIFIGNNDLIFTAILRAKLYMLFSTEMDDEHE
jgi:hypothetical protein